MDDLESDYSDDDSDGYVDDEIQERMTGACEIGGGLGGDWRTGGDTEGSLKWELIGEVIV